MAAQATWISELPEVKNRASFENDDATSTVALDSDEVRGRELPRIIGKSDALRRVLGMVRGGGSDRRHGIDQRGNRNWQGTNHRGHSQLQ